ncbi:MAG TPA: histidine kinase [Mycobacteriales bacterium]|nr:histidine kinase [Mycobacteriales bacterium]
MNATAIGERWGAGVLRLWRPTGPSPRPSRWDWAVDAILAVALAVGVIDAVRRQYDTTLIPLPPPGIVRRADDPGSADYVLAALTALPLAFRRRLPLAVFWCVMAAALQFHRTTSLPPQFSVDAATIFPFVSLLIAAYSATTHSPYRVPAVLSLVVGAVTVGVFHDRVIPSITPGYVVFLLLILVGIAANTVHTWKQRVHALEAEQEAATHAAVGAERTRIARELHDVVTHNVSVMVIQAGAARKVLDSAPDQARDALLAVESGGRAALTELRHVMGLLVPDPDGLELAPQPGLDQLPALAERVRDSGVPVELAVTGAPARLPAGAELAAFRVVQEALTNAVKHAAGARVRITVEYRPDAVRVEVTDTGGVPSPSAGTGSGSGLIGLRERLAVCGGTLQAGIRPTGGYRVRAVIPVEQP